MVTMVACGLPRENYGFVFGYISPFMVSLIVAVDCGLPQVIWFANVVDHGYRIIDIASIRIAKENKAVIDRRLRPLCCHLGSYFKCPKSSPVRPLACTYITAHSL